MEKSNPPPQNPAATKQRIGDALIDHHLIHRRQWRPALTTQSQTGNHPGSIPIEMGFVTIENRLGCLEQQPGVPAINRYDIHIDIDKPLPDLITREKIFTARVLPIQADKHTLTLAMVNPHDFVAISEIGFTVGKNEKEPTV